MEPVVPEEEMRVKLIVCGKSFSPKEASERTGLSLSECVDPNLDDWPNREEGRRRPPGSATVRVPEDVPWDKQLQVLGRLVGGHLSELRSCGATDMYIDRVIFNSRQGNDALTIEEIAALARLSLPLAISMYSS